jgi:hypothetical protein
LWVAKRQKVTFGFAAFFLALFGYLIASLVRWGQGLQPVAEERSECGLGPRFVIVAPSYGLFRGLNTLWSLGILNPIADCGDNACRCQTAGWLFGLHPTLKLAEHLWLIALLDHLKRPRIAFYGREQKDGPYGSDHKLDDSNAVLNIQAGFEC